MEEQILAFWEGRQIFQQVTARRAAAPRFTFYEGPPTANGQPGIHHVLGRTIKDVFCRYRSQKGYRVDRKAGWDTHGLPVEIEVEKQLGLKSHAEVEAYGIARYNQACRDSVLRYKQVWDRLTKRIGYWVDLDDPYITFEPRYIETVWWLIRRIHDLGLLYRGHKIQWYSPGSGTVLSSHEVSLGYKEVQDPSVTVRFRVAGEPDLALLAWTTTPWTLPSNLALAVGPDIEYVRVRRTTEEGRVERLILARARLEAVLKGETEGREMEIEASFPGSALVGTAYEPLYTLAHPDLDPARAFRVVAADYVSTSDGTGIVHIAPAFGAEDHEVGKQEDLPLLNPVLPNGHFAADTPLVGGLWFKDADKVIVRDLRERGLLFRREDYLHNYPHDWRKGTPLMSYPVDSWFIRTTARRDELVALNREIRWFPPSIGEGRFGNWLENNVDWALSRNRYWGTPLPVWCSDQEGSEYFEVIGSFAELREKCGAAAVPEDGTFDPHRPYVDDLTWPAPDGGTMRRVPYVVDVWFDSGAMPFAQWHYPFAGQEANAACEANFPADFICEGLDQTRGWFYTLHAIAVLTRGSVAFKNVVVNGLLLDEKGEKMSKSKGNTVDPDAILREQGADVLRWYLISNSPPWENMKFSARGVTATQRKFFNTLENTYGFFASYANIDGYAGLAGGSGAAGEAPLPLAGRSELDRWILSRLASTMAEVDQSFAEYDSMRAARAMERFVDELSNWYIRRSRRRFWKAARAGVGTDRDKLAAYQTTEECLATLARAMAPIAPFFAEWLYRCLLPPALAAGAADAAPGTAGAPPESVHLCDFPTADAQALDPALERRMALARSIVTAALLLRNKCGINVRQPLPRLLVVTGGAVEEAAVAAVREVILEEVNCLALEYLADTSEVVRRSAKANFPVLGKRLGKRMKATAAAILALDEAAIATYLRDGAVELSVEGEPVRIEAGEMEIQSEEVGGWLVACEDGVTVALDTARTPELIALGLARETVNRIQNLRKSSQLELTDRIHVAYQATPALAAAIAAHREWIAAETLALSLSPIPADALPATMDAAPAAATASPAGPCREGYDIDAERLDLALTRA
jgi:isoleucyl-tRNA synthetase